jgi:YebC/PmpR family DNA-binding regulatory protein
VLVETATDNRNRTAAEVRSIFTKSGGQLAGSGAVAWQFEIRGLITVSRDGVDPDEVALAAIDAGAADVDTDTDPIEIYTEPSDLEAVRKALDAAGVAVEEAESAMIPKQTTTVDADHVRQVLRLMDLLEDIEDVQRVTSNADIPEELMEEYAG